MAYFQEKLVISLCNSLPLVSTSRTAGGTAQGAGCKFPFLYKGPTDSLEKSYSYCTSVGRDKPWCSTTAKYNGTWGYCEGKV